MMQDYNPTLAPPTGADLNNPLTPQQLAARLGVSLFTLKLWRLTNKGPSGSISTRPPTTVPRWWRTRGRCATG